MVIIFGISRLIIQLSLLKVLQIQVKFLFKIDAGTPGNTVTIKSSGKVGIGVSTPEHKLEVDGDMQVDDYLYFGDSWNPNWRIKAESGKLTFEKKVGDNWVVSNEFE